MADFLFTTVITKNFANKDLTAMETGDTDKLKYVRTAFNFSFEVFEHR